MANPKKHKRMKRITVTVDPDDHAAFAQGVEQEHARPRRGSGGAGIEKPLRNETILDLAHI